MATDNAPLITVIIPVHNELTIHQVLEFLLKLKYPRDKLELIMVDDSTTNEISQIIKRFISQSVSQFCYIKWIKLPQRVGVSHARNIGIENASGDYVLLLDSDVVLTENALLELLQTLRNHEECGAVSAIYIHDAPSIIEKITLRRYIGRIKEGPLFTGASLIPKHVIEKVGSFNEKLGYPYTVYEDWEYQVRIEKLGLRTLVNGKVVLQHLHKVGMQQKSQNPLNNILTLLASYFSFRKAFALHEVLKHAPWRLRLEYIFHSLLVLATLVLFPINYILIFFLWLVVLTLTVCYYAIEMRGNILHASQYSIATLIARTTRAFTLTIYLMYRCIKAFHRN